jgi:hypothetical protein
VRRTPTLIWHPGVSANPTGGASNAGALVVVLPPGAPGHFPVIGGKHGSNSNLRFRSQGSGLVRAMVGGLYKLTHSLKDAWFQTLNLYNSNPVYP